jgi:hypothetical protein
LLQGSASPVAFDVHLEDLFVMIEPVDRCECHGGIGKWLPPFTEWLVCGDQHRSPLVSGADEFESHVGLGLVLGNVGEISEDQQIETVEPVNDAPWRED